MNLEQMMSFLDDDIFKNFNGVNDYCVNGLQIGNTSNYSNIKKIVTGVTLENDLIDSAIDQNAGAILVHHGMFWNYQKHNITGKTYEKMEKLIKNNIALVGYHLPLDFHPLIGNNYLLFVRVLDALSKINKSVIGFKKVSDPTSEKPVSVYEIITDSDKTKPTSSELHQALSTLIGGHIHKTHNDDSLVEHVGICTGGGQGYFNVNDGYDAYITGEVGLPQSIMAKEHGKSFFAAGHHATERYGIEELGNKIASRFGVDHVFFDIFVDA